ncbi:MAG: hypothetical protein J6S81_00495 [Treponema sp.]|nr:hypothetical protein [Treponema sp.]
MSVRIKVFAMVFWFSCAVALILIGKEDRPLQGGASVEGAAVEASVQKANEESALYMKHVILAFFAFAPALGVCAAFIESRSSGKKENLKKEGLKKEAASGGKKSVPEKETGPVFTGSFRSLSIEEKVKVKK